MSLELTLSGFKSVMSRPLRSTERVPKPVAFRLSRTQNVVYLAITLAVYRPVRYLYYGY